MGAEPRSGGAGQLHRVAEEVRSPEKAQLREALVDGRVPVRNAAVILSEMDRLRSRLRPDAVPTVWDALITLGEVVARETSVDCGRG